MMKKILAFAFAACLLLPAAAPAAEYGMYVTPKIGAGIQHFKSNWENNQTGASGTKGVFGAGLALGYDLQPTYALPLRAELEYTYWTRAEQKTNGREYHAKARVGIQSLFANVYADWHNDTAFTPYVGAGIGIGFVTTKADESDWGYHYSYGSKTKAGFAWNLGLGCSYAFTDTISADLGYRFASFNNGKTGETQGAWLKSKNNYMHQFMLGARFTF